MQISFSPPDISDLEIEEVVDTLKSGWITTGPKTKEFERKIAEFCSVKKAVCLNSQTACSEMALRLLGIGPGDEVITCAYTYTASASVVEHVGAKLILIDTQKDSFEMDYSQLERAITDKTKVVIPVDIGGIPCDYDKIFSILEGKRSIFEPKNELQASIGRVIVNADTAHAFGAKYKGVPVGSVADFSGFSFHAVKNLTTAEGGALTWKSIKGVDDNHIYQQLQLLSLHGQTKDAMTKTQTGSWEYDIVGPWYKCNMTDIMAGIGLAQLRRYESMLSRRKEIVIRYDSAFVPMGIKVLPHYRKDHQSSGHLYLARVPGVGEEERQEILEHMLSVGVSCNVHYKPLPMLTAYKNLGFDIRNFPNAYEMYKNEISLPLHTKLSDEEVDHIIEHFSKVVERYI